MDTVLLPMAVYIYTNIYNWIILRKYLLLLLLQRLRTCVRPYIVIPCRKKARMETENSKKSLKRFPYQAQVSTSISRTVHCIHSILCQMNTYYTCIVHTQLAPHQCSSYEICLLLLGMYRRGERLQQPLPSVNRMASFFIVTSSREVLMPCLLYVLTIQYTRPTSNMAILQPLSKPGQPDMAILQPLHE